MQNQTTVWQNQSSEAILRQMSILEQAGKEHGLNQVAQPGKVVDENAAEVASLVNPEELSKGRAQLDAMQELADKFYWKTVDEVEVSPEVWDERKITEQDVMIALRANGNDLARTHQDLS